MANTKSAAKAASQAEIRRQRNMHYKRTLRTKVKQVRQAVEAGEQEKAQTALQDATKYIQHTASKGIIHKRTASRSISRLTKAVNGLSAEA